MLKWLTTAFVHKHVSFDVAAARDEITQAHEQSMFAVQ
jgi:hypothetical protein